MNRRLRISSVTQSWWSFFLLCLGTLNAQTPPPLPSVPLQAQINHAVSISAGGAAGGDDFLVCKSDSMHLAILLPMDGCSLTLTSPSGIAQSWDPQSTAVTCYQIPIQPDGSLPPVAYVYHFIVPSPLSGQWHLAYSTPSPVVSDWNALESVDFISTIGVGLFSTVNQILLGGTVSISLAVQDGSTPLAGYQVQARLYREGDLESEYQNINFSAITDPSTGASTLVASLSPAQQGTYDLIAIVTGSEAGSAYERYTSSTFTVLPPRAQFTGSVTQRIDLSFPATTSNQ